MSDLTPDPFCKLFETEDRGQILVMIRTDDETGKPEVRTYAQPVTLGLCSLALGFDDTERGWKLADKAFAAVDEARARAMTDQIFRLAE